ncbi:MAG: hypothetical protein AMJ43_07265 [Coxiella sp. DG_40]|nr:MAG: hypothetical protein AMJ43_07265 [Coxiella sp. DG_40]
MRYMYEYLVFFLLASWKLNWLYLKKRFQTVEVDGMPDFLVFSTLVPKIFRAKIIFNVLDSVPLVFSDRFKSGHNHPVIRMLELVEKASMHYADHVIFPGCNMREKWVKSRGLDNSKTSVALNVPDENIFHARSGPHERQDDGSFHLITHGSLLEKYGIQTLIKAVPLLIPHIPKLKVTIVGEGEYRPYLEQLVESMGLEEHVHFTGFIPMERVPGVISQADVGVVCLLIHMLPTKLFEYIALGKPVISTYFPAVKIYFDEAVMYYEPGDEVGLARCALNMYQRPEERTRLIESADSIYQQYRWDMTKYEYLRIFNQ